MKLHDGLAGVCGLSGLAPVTPQEATSRTIARRRGSRTPALKSRRSSQAQGSAGMGRAASPSASPSSTKAPCSVITDTWTVAL